MTNYEKYKDIILKTAKEGETIHPAMVDGELTDCMNTACTSCDFAGKDMECDSGFIEWLYEKFEPKPKKTRQSEFLKMYPNARLNSKGILDIRPCNIDTSYSTDHCYFACGDECQSNYWLQEVEK